MICNICGGENFEPFRNRGNIRCTGCGSIERTRLLAMFLDKFATLRPGMRVLHFAPERQLFKKIGDIVGEGYHVRDIDVARYSKLKIPGVQVERFDLCNDLDSLPADYYDLIIHNHVMEHVPCNVTAVLWHLHRSLSENGLHMFSVPMSSYYEESLAPMAPEQRDEKFKHPEHMRIFGMKDLQKTIGMIFDIEDQIKNTPRDYFGDKALEDNNIPESRRKKFDGASVFVLGKGDLKLK